MKEGGCSLIDEDHSCCVSMILNLRYFQRVHFIHHINSGCGKREAHIKWSMVTCKGSSRYWNYLEGYLFCAGGLSVVNTLVTQLIKYVIETEPMAAGGINKE